MLKRFVFALVCMAAVPVAAIAQNLSVQRIEVQGAQRVDPQTVVSYLTVHVGDLPSDTALTDSTKALFASGLFSDVNVRMDGDKLVVAVAENALINEVAFEGNDKLKDKDLLPEIQSKSRSVLSRPAVQRDVDRIIELYRRQGRFSAKVEPKIIQLDQNRVNLVFEITEGDVSHVKGIKFVGNHAFTDDQLREVIASREDAWYRFLSTADKYDPDRAAYDQDLLRRHYLRNGYVDFHMLSAIAQLSEDKKSFYMTFTVDEGEKYTVSGVHVDASSLAPRSAPAKLNEAVKLKSGETYNADLLDDSISEMTKVLSSNQFPFVAVRPDVKKDASAKTIDLTFKTEDAPKVFVERINIRGNLATQDKVVRREFDMAEGDPYDKTKVAKAEQDIKDLDFFEKVTVDTQAGNAPDQAVVNVDVQEKSTGQISLSGGLATDDGPFGDFGIQERNFLGKGQNLKFSTLLSAKRLEFDLGLTEPYFMDRNLAATIDAFHATRDQQKQSQYDQKRTGGGLKFAYPLSSTWSQSIGYRLENNEIYNVQDTASRYIKDQTGTRLTSALSQRLVYDTRDSKLFPADGLMSWIDAEGAGLGGDARYVSGKVGTVKYFPLSRDKDYVLSILGETGAIHGLSKDVKINERYFIGGETLRGFAYGGVGARDTATGDALGANMFYRGSAELQTPSGLPEEMGVQTYFFSDLGAAWKIDETGPTVADSSTPRVSAGIGIGWKSPMGPIRLDFAKPVVDKSYDKKEVLRFRFGTSF